MGDRCKTAIACFIALIMLATLALGCGKKAGEEVVIKLGYIADFTGAASPAFVPYTQAYQDALKYLESEDAIPGVKVELITYDTMMDPARAIPSYDWMKNKRATALVCSLPQIAEILPPFLERDKMVCFAGQQTPTMLESPWIFGLTETAARQYKTITKYIGDRWTSYPQKPKIGVVGWNTSYELAIAPAIKEYCQDHPDKFEYVGTYLAPAGTMTWSGEVSKLKDCDYICACHGGGAGQLTFMGAFRSRGYTATFFSSEGMAVWRNLLVDSLGYEALNGSLSFHGVGWWTDSYPIIDLAKSILRNNRPGQADDIIYSGYSYLSAVPQLFFLHALIKATAERVGAKNVDSEAIRDTAIGFRYTFEGFPDLGYIGGDRTAVHFGAVYEWSAEARDLVRVGDWIQTVE